MNRHILWLICSLILITHNIESQSWVDSLIRFGDNKAKLEYLDKQSSRIIYSDPVEAEVISLIYDSIALITEDPIYLGNSQILKGNIPFVKGNHDEALPLFISALELLEPIGTTPFLAKAYNNLASCYQVRNDNTKSTEYFNKALSIYEALNDSLWIANVHSNLGLQYLNDDILDKAEYHLNEAVSGFEIIGNDIFRGIALLNRGNLKIEQEAYPSAIADYKKSQLLVPGQISPLVGIACEAGMGTAYNRSGNPQKAIPLLTSSLDRARAIQQMDQVRESNRELAQAHKSLGNYKKALQYQESYTAIKDSLFTIAQDSELANALTKYESEKKESKIALLNAEGELQSARLHARNSQLVLAGIGSLILLGLLATLYKLYQQVNRQNQIITTALGEKDTLLREIHHRVKNNLQVISALLTLQSKHVKDDQAVLALQEGQGRVQSMALIHQDLYQHDNLKGVNTKDYFEKLTDNLIGTYNTQDRNIELECDIEPLLLDVDTMIPLGLVVNELTSNALKHAFAQRTSGSIKISLKEVNQTLQLIVQDDGKGVQDDTLENKSFGFSLIQSFARRLDAHLDIENKGGLKVQLLINNYQKAA